MQLVDRIEKRRFVGREFLLWLWFESEIFDATLSTREHGPFGLWLEKRLVLSVDKQSTRITALSPGRGREAKEALLAGQLPESAGIRIHWRDQETGFLLHAERLAIAGLKLQTVLDQEPEERSELIEQLKGGVKARRARARTPEQDAAYEEFYERMRLTEEFEGLLEALYADFLGLRLSETWTLEVVPRLRAWAAGAPIGEQAYATLRQRSTTPIGHAATG